MRFLLLCAQARLLSLAVTLMLQVVSPHVSPCCAVVASRLHADGVHCYLQADLKKANEEKKALETSLQGLKAQSKHAEKSYDELMADNMRLRKELSTYSDEPRLSKKGL
jgi:malate/lactate dehydrogenase